jgi:hypothetical protein
MKIIVQKKELEWALMEPVFIMAKVAKKERRKEDIGK